MHGESGFGLVGGGVPHFNRDPSEYQFQTHESMHLSVRQRVRQAAEVGTRARMNGLFQHFS